MLKAKKVIGPLPTKSAELWSENRTNPKEAKAEHLLKANSNFFNDNRMR